MRGRADSLVEAVQILVCESCCRACLHFTNAFTKDDGDDEDGPVTMANMERKTRALDRQHEEDARLDVEEMQHAADVEEDDDDDMDEEFEGDFVLPSAEEREAERKSGGTDLAGVQRRIQICSRILSNFKKYAATGR